MLGTRQHHSRNTFRKLFQQPGTELLPRLDNTISPPLPDISLHRCVSLQGGCCSGTPPAPLRSALDWGRAAFHMPELEMEQKKPARQCVFIPDERAPLMPEQLESHLLWVVEGHVLGQQPRGTHTCAPRDQRPPSHCRELPDVVQAVLGARTRVSVSVRLGKANLYLLRPLKEYWLCKSFRRTGR